MMTKTTTPVESFGPTIATLRARVAERALDQAIRTVERAGHPVAVSVGANGKVTVCLLGMAEASQRGYLDGEENVPFGVMESWQQEADNA